MNRVVSTHSMTNIIKNRGDQFTMNHDDGNLIKEINESDIVLLSVEQVKRPLLFT